MVTGDLFSGIGGFALAARWMGWSTAWFSEIDPYASRVLAKHWPDVPNLGDITRVDWSQVAPVDVLTGGFPCQPHSLAGKRAGSNDERDLFSEIIRCAGVLRPRFIVLENSPGILTSDRGRFFGRVLGALAALRYDAEWRVLAASDVGAPHKRERIWITAHTERFRQPGQGVGGNAVHPAPDAFREADRLVDAVRKDTLPFVCRGHDGISNSLDAMRGLGNAIVPQCAQEIFQVIRAREAQRLAA